MNLVRASPPSFIPYIIDENEVSLSADLEDGTVRSIMTWMGLSSSAAQGQICSTHVGPVHKGLSVQFVVLTRK
jgi:hypothetical protein